MLSAIDEAMFQRDEEAALERAGLDSREGMKIWDYCSMSFRYYCMECASDPFGGDAKEITNTVKKVGDAWHCECECGWRTVEFTEHG